MKARLWVFDVLVNSIAIRDHVGHNIIQASSMGLDPDSPSPQKPFLIYRSELSDDALMPGVVETIPFTFYVHDEQGSYLNHIEPTLEAIHDAFDARSPEFWNGTQIFDAVWRGTSGDLYDDMWRTSMKYATINIVCKG